MASYDRVNWFRVPTRYEDGVMVIEHVPLSGSIYYAYFEPYSYDQHLNLIGQAQAPACARCPTSAPRCKAAT